MEAYQRAVRRVLECGGERLSLSVSYRSPAAILDPINRVFSEWIGPRAPSEGAFEPAYEPIESAREGGPGTDPRVEIWTVTATGNAADRRRAEAGALAAFIASSAGGAGAPLRFRDVAILFRALTHAPLYTQALRHAGIPFVVEGGRDFYERQEVGDLISFLRAASNPNDAAAVLAVMRSPLGGVPDAELARYAAAGGRLDRTRPPHVEGCDGVRRTLSILAGFRGRTWGAAPTASSAPRRDRARGAGGDADRPAARVGVRGGAARRQPAQARRPGGGSRPPGPLDRGDPFPPRGRIPR